MSPMSLIPAEVVEKVRVVLSLAQMLSLVVDAFFIALLGGEIILFSGQEEELSAS